MNLTEKQKDRIAQVFSKRLVKVVCPVCKNKGKWDINDMLFQISEYTNGAIFPVLAAICPECGYTMLFSALKIGLLDDKGVEK